MATMTRAQRTAFLADVHVGVLSVNRPDGGRAPLAVPIWYAWSTDGVISVVTSSASQKGRAIEAAGRYSLVAQQEAPPYRYVGVEGPVVTSEACELERDLRPLATRYLGAEAGGAYAEAWHALDPSATVYRMRPEHWLSYDATDELGI